jgi:hypothetical protein
MLPKGVGTTTYSLILLFVGIQIAESVPNRYLEELNSPEVLQKRFLEVLQSLRRFHQRAWQDVAKAHAEAKIALLR